MLAPSSADHVLATVPLEGATGQSLERLDVPGPGALDDVGRQLGTRRRLVPAAALEPVAHELLIVTRLRPAGLVGGRLPEPARIGCQDLVHEDQLAVREQAQLE